ncbi:MAG: hypothetical protein P8Y14_27260 [Anaerolineales bacterium]|jgi:Tol biopolymer transport system component
MALRSYLLYLTCLLFTGVLLSCNYVHPGERGAASGVDVVQLPSEFDVWYAKLSPNGEEIALISQKPGELRGVMAIYLYKLKSEDVVQIPTNAERFSIANRFDPNQIDWAPDGTTLAVAGGPMGQSDKDGIWLVNLENYDMELLTKGTSLSWSPSGDRMAIMDTHAYSSAVKILNLRDREERVIREFQHEGSITFLDLDWSPTEDTLAISVPGENSEGYRWDRLYLLRVDGSRFDPILEDSAWRLYNPIWLPNGKWLTLIAYSSEGGIVAVAPFTGECIFSWLPEITKVDRIDISQDGKKLLIVSWGRLFLVDLEKAVGSHLLPDQLQCP